MSRGLTERQVAVLDLERQRWARAGAKDQAIRELGMTSTGYHQVLNALLDDPAALERDPLLVHRLRRVRAGRRRRAG